MSSVNVEALVTDEPRKWTVDDFDKDLDPGIASIVIALCEHGVETYESCQGGEGHAYPEPTVAFHGADYEGFRALSVAMMLGLPVYALHRVWRMDYGQPTGPNWLMTFRTSSTPEAKANWWKGRPALNATLP